MVTLTKNGIKISSRSFADAELYIQKLEGQAGIEKSAKERLLLQGWKSEADNRETRVSIGPNLSGD